MSTTEEPSRIHKREKTTARNAFKNAWRALEEHSEKSLEDAETSWYSAESQIIHQHPRRPKKHGSTQPPSSFTVPILMVTDPKYVGVHVSVPITIQTVKELIKSFSSNTKLHPLYVERILSLAKNHLEHHCTTLMSATIPSDDDGKLIIVGDLHGQFLDLKTILDKYGLPGPKNVYIFNGDMVDRGPSGVQIVLVIYSLLLSCPNYVFINRGNHEQLHLNEKYTFATECFSMYGEKEFKLFEKTFKMLPLATLINNQILVLHGGLSSDPNFSLSQLSLIKRVNIHHGSKNEHQEEIIKCILWSDPQNNNGIALNTRGSGILWGPDITERFLQQNKLSLIIRSHELKDEGFEFQHGNRVLTLFSASCYCGTNSNKAAVAIYQRQGRHFPPELPRVDSFFAVVPSEIEAEQCKQTTVEWIKNEFFMQRHALIKAFSHLEDIDNNGTISIEDFCKVLGTVIQCQIQWEILWPYFASEDDNARINFSHFLASQRINFEGSFLKQWIQNTAETICIKMKSLYGSLTKSFEKIDVDNSGDISFQEFDSALTHFNIGLTEENIFDLFQSLDISKNGKIELSEFTARFETLFQRISNQNNSKSSDSSLNNKKQIVIEKLKSRLSSIEVILDPLHKGFVNVGAMICFLDHSIGIKLSEVELGSIFTIIDNKIITMENIKSVLNSPIPTMIAATKSMKDVMIDTGNDFKCSLLNSIARILLLHSVQIQRFFKQMDVDQTGFLTFGEFDVGMKILNELLIKSKAVALSDEDIKSLFQIVDKNSDGKITWEEFSEGFLFNPNKSTSTH